MRVLFALSCALLLAGCAFSTEVPTKELPGTYVASYPFGSSTLIVRPDHSFSQTVVVGSAREELSGSWRADGNRIHFSQFIVPADGFGELENDWRRHGATRIPRRRAHLVERADLFGRNLSVQEAVAMI